MKTCPKCLAEHEQNGRFCSRKCANSRVWSAEDKKKKSDAAQRYWNTLDAIDHKERCRDTCNKMLETRKLAPHGWTKEQRLHLSLSKKGKTFITEEGRLKLSKSAIQRNLGGHTSKKKMEYMKADGTIVYLQSSYEIKYAAHLDNNKIAWIRPAPLLWVDTNNKEHRYYADFYLPNYDVYVDTKNDYLIEKDKEKIQRVIEQNSVIVKILSEQELMWLPH